jgi:hypothetical protein
MQAKPGWKTTEFWVTVGTSLWAIFGHVLPPVAQAVVVGVAQAAYAVSRAVTKNSLSGP